MNNVHIDMKEGFIIPKINKDLKAVILNSSKEIAIQQGISKLNIRIVAKKSGIAIGTIYNYYPKKSNLIIAVIEDFWSEAFTTLNKKNQVDNDFFKKIQVMYYSLFDNVKNFKENWLEQLSILNNSEKAIGKQKENEYFKMAYEYIANLIDEDENIKKNIYTSTLTKEKITEFIFDNMLLLLKKEEKNIDFFIDILKKIL